MSFKSHGLRETHEIIKLLIPTEDVEVVNC